MPPTPQQLAARQTIADALAVFTATTAARQTTATAPPSDARDAQLEAATSDLAAARDTISAAQQRLVGRGLGLELFDPTLPVLLLPVRLEARLAWRIGDEPWVFSDPGGGATRHLLVRLAPDSIHVDAHDPALSPSEIDALKRFREAAPANRVAAWTRLAADVGPDRALWVARHDSRKPARRLAGWTHQKVARLLPDRWAVVVHLHGPQGPRRASALGRVVPTPLPLTVDPLDPATDAVAWVNSFDAAVAAGMGVAVALVDPAGVPLPGDPQRVVAVGVAARHDPDGAVTALLDLLESHHMNDGTRICSPGDPTTSSSLGRAVTARRTDLTQEVLEAENQRTEPIAEVTPHNLDVPADRLAFALGTPRLPWRILPGALTDGAAERHLRQVVASAIQPVVSELIESTVAEAVLDQYVNTNLSALGPFPILLVGSQPYGLLPVMPLLDTAPAAEPLAVVEAIRLAWWEPAIERVPRLGRIGRDGLAELLAVLGRDSAPHRFDMRVGVNGAIAALFTGGDTPTDPVPTLEAAFGAATTTRFASLLDVLFHPGAAPLASSISTVDRRDNGGPLIEPAGYLAELASARLADLVAGTPGLLTGVDAPLLYQLARAALLACLDTAIRDAAASGTISGFGTLPGWTTPVSEPMTEDLWTVTERMGLGVSATETILDVFQRDPPPQVTQLRVSLGRLASTPAAQLETITRHVLGLAARIDPWYTTAAWDRLAQLRAPTDPGVAVRPGLQLGGYGVLEGFVPDNAIAAPRGYVHAPGATHAVTAAVLHAAHRQRHRDSLGLAATDAAAVQATTAIRLDGPRVRRALQLLDGLRAGQPLAELLGADLEATLAARGRQELIAPLRASFPGTQGPTAPGAVADGLAALRAAGFPGSPTTPLPITTNAAAAANLAEAIADTASTLDALADLLLGDAVHQLGAGRWGRAAALADFAAAARVAVPEPQLPATDRTGTSHPTRVVVILPDPAEPPDGWPVTPRTLAAPALACWAAEVLGSPAAIVVWCTMPATDDQSPAGEFRPLTDLFDGLAEDDPARFGPLELVAASDSGAQPGTALYTRVTRLATKTLNRPVIIDPNRADNLPDGTHTVARILHAARHLAKVLGAARPLTPQYLTPPGSQPDGTGDVDDFAERADTAAATLADAATLLQLDTSTPLDTVVDALLAADLAGVTSPVPDDPATARAAASSAATEATRRHSILPARPIGGSPPSATLHWAAAVLDAVFGGLPLGARLDLADHPLTATSSATGAALRAWMTRAATVRTPIRNQFITDLLATAAGHPAGLRAVRLPTGTWTPTPAPPGSVDLVALMPAGEPDTNTATGVLLDEWSHTVPAATIDTAVTFHQPTPSASAPQVLLLAVPPAGTEEWTTDLLERIVDEALHLARLRAVDLADLGANQLLPPLLSSCEPPNARPYPIPPDGLAPDGLTGT